MDRPDYQMALLLQRQLEQENLYDADLHLATRLQENFNKEVETENPVTLVYDRNSKSKQDMRSLVDPSWELIDPTPNIFHLFVAFNQRLFWNKLVAVCVSWSKKMTACAGICSYQGKGGMCSITLSEPLLKLRPRKDLIETLLHEMIHAYLFVTHNNKDRDGHGPEFHKHMYRINKEVGTNITVYHTFHDEVSLYQQHWWRCSGPCQNWRPYFGMVRRAMNRAPGPYDKWWSEHARACGGTFVKVREPEKKTKVQKQNKPIHNTVSAGDIRNFLPNLNKNSPTINSGNPQTENTNIYGFNNLKNYSQNSLQVSQVPGTGNIQNFVNNGSSNNRFNYTGNTVKTRGNSNSTIVINKKPTTLDKNKNKGTLEKTIDPFSGTGQFLNSTEKVNYKHSDVDYSVVRNHWINKFSSVSTSASKRSTNSMCIDDESTKKQKTEHQLNHQDIASSITLGDFKVICPVCEKSVKESLLNSHLDLCLQNQETGSTNAKNKDIAQVDCKSHFHNTNEVNDEQIECEICNLNFSKNRIESHRKLCIEEAFANLPSINSNEHFPTSESSEGAIILSQCPVCDDFIDSKELNNHKERCLLKVYDDIDNKYNLNEEIDCLVCGRKVIKCELNAHLDDCMGNVFDVKNDFNIIAKNEGNSHDSSCNYDSEISKESKYNCPFCMELYSELDMSGHLDQCLVSDMDSNNKSILIDSFSNDIL